MSTYLCEQNLSKKLIHFDKHKNEKRLRKRRRGGEE